MNTNDNSPKINYNENVLNNLNIDEPIKIYLIKVQKK